MLPVPHSMMRMVRSVPLTSYHRVSSALLPHNKSIKNVRSSYIVIVYKVTVQSFLKRQSVFVLLDFTSTRTDDD
jgi:hypothetical protein